MSVSTKPTVKTEFQDGEKIYKYPDNESWYWSLSAAQKNSPSYQNWLKLDQKLVYQGDTGIAVTKNDQLAEHLAILNDAGLKYDLATVQADFLAAGTNTAAQKRIAEREQAAANLAGKTYTRSSGNVVGPREQPVTPDQNGDSMTWATALAVVNRSTMTDLTNPKVAEETAKIAAAKAAAAQDAVTVAKMQSAWSQAMDKSLPQGGMEDMQEKITAVVEDVNTVLDGVAKKMPFIPYAISKWVVRGVVIVAVVGGVAVASGVNFGKKRRAI